MESTKWHLGIYLQHRNGETHRENTWTQQGKEREGQTESGNDIYA